MRLLCPKPYNTGMDYSRLIEGIVSDLLEVGVLPDSVISKAADGGWEKKEVAPGEVSPLAKSGIRSPRVNMGMKTPTTTFLPFAGLSPAVKEVRARTGDEDVQVVPGEAESSAVLLKTAPKAKQVPLMAAYAKKTPQQFTNEVGRKHLIILGPASKMSAGLETQKAVFGHEAGHVLNKDTTRFNSVRMHDLDIPDEEIVSREEGAWKTGNALLKDMGMSSDPHMEKAALHTYYDEHDPAKADITNLNPDEAKTLLHVLKQPDSYYKDTFRLGSKIHRGPDSYMQDRYKAVMGKIDEVTLPKDTSVESLNKNLDRAHAAWSKEMDTTTDLNNPKLAALSDNYVYFDQLVTAAGYPSEVAPRKMDKVLKQAQLQQAIKRK